MLFSKPNSLQMAIKGMHGLPKIWKVPGDIAKNDDDIISYLLFLLLYMFKVIIPVSAQQIFTQILHFQC